MKIDIRLMKKENLKDVSKIFVKVYTDFDVGEKWDEKSAYKLMSHYLEKQPDLCFIAELDEKIVGAFFAFIKPWWDGNHLVEGELFVDTDYQNKGIGTKLSKVMYGSAIKKYNVKCVDGITFKNKEFPLKWHKSIGFEINKDWTIISGDPRKLLKNLEKK